MGKLSHLMTFFNYYEILVVVLVLIFIFSAYWKYQCFSESNPIP